MKVEVWLVDGEMTPDLYQWMLERTFWLNEMLASDRRRCQECDTWFWAKAGSKGGRPRLYCSEACRIKRANRDSVKRTKRWRKRAAALAATAGHPYP